jgi:protein ImuA
MTLRHIQRSIPVVGAPAVCSPTQIGPRSGDLGRPRRKAMLQRLRHRLDVLERRGLFEHGSATADRTVPVLPFDIAEIDACLPHRGLAVAALHEVTCAGGEVNEETGGQAPADPSSEVAMLFFTAYLAARRSRYIANGQMNGSGAVLWICRRLTPHGPGLAASGLPMAQTIFVRVRDDEAALWAMEEALKCRSLSAVVAEVRRVGLSASRRLQLAAEAHGVTGLLLRPAYSSFAASAVHSRWRIRSATSAAWNGEGLGLSTELQEQLSSPPNMPPINMPQTSGTRALGAHCLRVELLRTRGGGQGQWTLQWNEMNNNEAYQEGTFGLAAPLADGPLPADAGTPGAEDGGHRAVGT